MKMITIKKIKENDKQELNIDIDVEYESLYGKYKTTNYKYILKMLDFDFYYIENSWLPFNIEDPEEYVVYLNNLEDINKITNFYTNVYDGINLVDVVIIYKENLNNYFLAKLECEEICLGKIESGEQYFIDLKNFYKKIFGRNVNCSIYYLETVFEAVSFPNLIVLNEGYLQRPKTYIYKFLPHEVFHQICGCYLKFIGIAKEWMRESFVEYLQLVFLKECINTKFFLDQLDGYKKFEKKWSNFGISLIDFNLNENIQQYNYVIYGRGVVVFHEIFIEDIDSIRRFIELLFYIKTDISIETYISSIEKASGISKDFIREKLKMKVLKLENNEDNK